MINWVTIQTVFTRLISKLMGYTGQRLLTACLVFASALVAAWVLEPALYGKVFLVIFIAKILLLGNIGSVSGYIHRFYNAGDAAPNNCAFILSYGVHLLLFAVMAAVVGFFLGEVYFLGAVSFLMLLPFFLVEPVLRVKRRFFISLLPDWALNASLLVGVIFYYLDSSSSNDLGSFITPYLYALSLFCFCFIFWLDKRWGLMRRIALVRPMVGYIKLVKIGLPLFLGTAAFSMFLFVDRFFLERYHSAESLGIYMLAFQLATGATLILTSLNFIAGVDCGELIKQGKPIGAFVARRLRQSLLISVVSISLLFVGSFILQRFFLQGYSYLTLSALLLGVGLCGFYTAGSITPVAFYLSRQKLLTRFMFFMMFLSVMGNLYVFNNDLDYIWVSGLCGLWLLCYACVAVCYVLRLNRLRAD